MCGTPPVLDLVHLGLGADGHTASLVAGDAALEVGDADVALTGCYQGHRRMTLTLPVLGRARSVLWIVTGAREARGPREAPRGRCLDPGRAGARAGRARARRPRGVAGRSAAPVTRPGAQRAAWALGGALALVALALLGVALRSAIAERALRWRLAARGVSPASLRVAQLGIHGIALREIVLGPPSAPDLAVAELDLSWSAQSLRDGLYDSARVAGLRLRGRLDEGGLHLGAADPLWLGSAEPTASVLLPARELELRGAQLVLDTAEGPALGELEGQLREADGKLTGRFELALRDGHEPPRVAPATLRAELSGPLRELGFELQLQGAEGRLRGEAHGHADLETRSGRAELRLAPLVLAPGGLQPATLLPALEPILASFGVAGVAGRIEARGTLQVSAGEPELRLELALRELGFESDLLRVSGVSGAIALRGPPLRTPAGQLLSVAVLDPGVPFTDGLLEFQLLPGGVLALHHATWNWAGGELRADDLSLALAAERTEARLSARNLDLAALLELVALEGLRGSGRIEGELPLVRSGGRIRVEGGVLRATAEGGRLRYQPSEAARAYAASRPDDLGLALAAFADFRYEALEAHLDGDLRRRAPDRAPPARREPGLRGGPPDRAEPRPRGADRGPRARRHGDLSCARRRREAPAGLLAKGGAMKPGPVRDRLARARRRLHAARYRRGPEGADRDQHEHQDRARDPRQGRQGPRSAPR